MYKMKKILLIILLTYCYSSWAQYSLPRTNLVRAQISIPSQNAHDLDFTQGTCRVGLNGSSTLRNLSNQYVSNPSILRSHIQNCFNTSTREYIPIEVVPITVLGWSLNFKFSFARTSYMNTDINVDGAELNGTIHNFNFNERTSSDYYNPNNWNNFSDSLKWIDEPTNYFTLTLTKNKNNIIISMYHPKWTIGTNTSNRVEGYLHGEYVDEFMDLDEPLREDYSNFTTAPGQLHLVRFENTHLQLEFALGYGRDFTLFATKKGHELIVQPAIYVGILTGANLTATRDHDDYWSFNGYKAPFQVQGPMIGFGGLIKYDFGLFDLFYQARYTRANINEREAWGGSVDYIHRYTTNTFGIGIDLSRVRRRKPLYKF